MFLYFVNGSHQQKLLLESDYADDLYDIMIGFFEEHGRYPHFLEMERYDDYCEVHFESATEYFLLSDVDSEEAAVFEGLVKEYDEF